ncbi:MAG: hypothetical protein AAF851_05785 [Myxococcota bacterium]
MSNDLEEPTNKMESAVDSVLKNHLPGWLAEPKVKVLCYIERKTKDGQDVALVKDGRPIVGRVEILTKAERQLRQLEGLPDAHLRFIMCAVFEANATKGQAQAGAHHQLASVERLDVPGKEDQPRLGTRKPDLIVSGYSEVARAHGSNSIEQQQLSDVAKSVSQLEMFPAKNDPEKAA